MNASESKRRWFHPTPGWLVVASLAISIFLLLSYRCQWYALSQIQWFTTLCVVANIAVTLSILLLWFIAALLLRRRFQFTIRSLLLLAVAIAVPFGWIASRMREAERQRQGVDLVTRLGGGTDENEHLPPLLDPFHRWLPAVFFNEVSYVTFRPKGSTLSDSDLREIVKLLPNTEALILKSTGVTDAGLDSLVGLKHLAYLSLSGTRITDAGLKHLTSLKKVYGLDLDSTSVTDAGLEILSGHEFGSLRLNGTRVTDSGLASIRGHKLYLLELNNTQVSDAGLTHLEKLEELQELLLTGTRITDSGLARLGRMKHLYQLDLSRTKINDEGVKHLENVTTLIDLDLSDTQISDRGLEYLKGMNQLQHLKLNKTNVTDRGLEKLVVMWRDGLGSGDKLSLLGTKTTKAGVKKLQQAWPNCTIER